MDDMGRCYDVSKIMQKIVVVISLCLIYLSLAGKNPYKQNNLIGNLEPYPDTLYYSVPAWNWVQGKGFEMSIEGYTINSVVPPLYGILLAPVFWLTNDVRSYYWLNIALCLLTIFLFQKLAEKLFGNRWLSWGLGIVWVSNFYFYNLPTLLMAENLLIPLTLATALVLMDKISLSNLRLSIVVAILLLLTKMSALPVIAILGLGTVSKLFKQNDKKLWIVAIRWGGLAGMLGGWYLFSHLPIWSGGNGDMNPINLGKNLLVYIWQLMGRGSSYLWYTNPLLDWWWGVMGVIGTVVGLVDKKYRQNTLYLVGIIAAVTVFHAMKSYPEGRYVSTLVPLVILLAGTIFAKLGKLAGVGVLLVLLIFLGSRLTINGFYERKVTTLRRQIMNNMRVDNEVPWNYGAVISFNQYFKVKDKDVYLATLLPAFYVNYFSNHNYALLPVSETQEFSGVGKGLIEQYYQGDGSLIKLYERLIVEGKTVYISNYYLANHRSDWDADYATIEKHFALAQVADGCMGLCKIYRLEIKIPSN